MPVPAPVTGDWSEDAASISAGFFESTAQLNNVHRFSPEQLALIRRAHNAYITELDVALGRLFTALRETGLLRDTLIVFTSDHGEMLGDHRMGAKSSLFEPSAHVPFLVRPPGEWDEDPRRGTVDDRLATLADILPTCLAAAGIEGPLPEGADGRDLLAADAPPRKRIFGQCNRQFGVIEGNWKYVFTSAGPAELLFDLGSDPMETHNLSRTEPHRCRAMREALEAELAAAGSPALTASGEIATVPARLAEDIRSWGSLAGIPL